MTGATTETYLYDRNRRYEVSKGTRCANAMVTFDGARVGRQWATARASMLAERAWRERWGDVPWDRVQMLITHVTIQVVCEFRVLD